MKSFPRSMVGPRSASCLLSLSLALLLPPACAAPPPAPAEAASASTTEAPFDLADPTRIAIGKKRFNVNCGAYCHGFEGSGGKTVPFRGNKDFTAPGAFKVITEGRRAADVMPPWGKAFTPEEIWELVAYLQFLANQPPAP